MTAIDLTEEMVVPTRTFRRRAFVFSVKVALCIAASIAIAEGASIVADFAGRQYRAGREYLVAQLGDTRIIRELVPVREVPVGELVRTLSIEFGVSPIVTEAIIEQESGWKDDALRFEPHVYARMKGRTDEERRMLASSFGLTVLKGNIKRTGKLRAALVAYNGSGPDAERYGERVLARIAEKLIEGRS